MYSPINRSSAQGTTGKLSEEERQVLDEAKTLYRKGEGLAAKKLSLAAGLYEPFGRWRDQLELEREKKLRARLQAERVAAESHLLTGQLGVLKKIPPRKAKVTKIDSRQKELGDLLAGG